MSKYCECADPVCNCKGKCNKLAKITLYRIDMDDYTGTAFCNTCADDAFESGVFSRRPFDKNEFD